MTTSEIIASYSNEQWNAALLVLKKMQACVSANDTYHYDGERSFNLHESFGICWHVYANTKPDLEIRQSFFGPVFVELGLDPSYPVEISLGLTEKAFYANSDKYNPGTEEGKARIALIDKLVKYCETKI